MQPAVTCKQTVCAAETASTSSSTCGCTCWPCWRLTSRTRAAASTHPSLARISKCTTTTLLHRATHASPTLLAPPSPHVGALHAGIACCCSCVPMLSACSRASGRHACQCHGCHCERAVPRPANTLSRHRRVHWMSSAGGIRSIVTLAAHGSGRVPVMEAWTGMRRACSQSGAPVQCIPQRSHSPLRAHSCPKPRSCVCLGGHCSSHAQNSAHRDSAGHRRLMTPDIRRRKHGDVLLVTYVSVDAVYRVLARRASRGLGRARGRACPSA